MKNKGERQQEQSGKVFRPRLGLKPVKRGGKEEVW